MMGKRPIKNLTGQKFGRLLCLSLGNRHGKSGRVSWFCKCDCGNVKEIVSKSLLNGLTKSCGCLRKENSSIRFTKHGQTKNLASSEYTAWKNMCRRVYDKNNPSYKNYGGRGVAVCERWLGNDGCKNFYFDMGQKPSRQHSLDRIDYNGNYEPSNCKWSTKQEQIQNRRNTLKIDGIPVIDFCKEHNLHYDAVRWRIGAGWSAQKILDNELSPFKNAAISDDKKFRSSFLSRKRNHKYHRAEDDLTIEQAKDVLQKQKYKCVYFDMCGKSIENGDKLEIDHIVSKSKGGFDTMSNIQWTCRSCNASKNVNSKPKAVSNRNGGRGVKNV